MPLTLKNFNRPPELCFTANTAGSTVQLTKTGSPTAVTLETSTDGSTRTTYTIGNTITLSNVGDKVYWRNTSEATTGFSTGTSDYYKFVMSGSINASGDISYMLCKNGSNTTSSYCFYYLFNECYSLTTPPKFRDTILSTYCYYRMFRNCTNLVSIPKLNTLSLADYCYSRMFEGCSALKLRTTQDSTYINAYRIPYKGTGTDGTNSLQSMFINGDTDFGSTPTINTTYYTSNTLI